MRLNCIHGRTRCESIWHTLKNGTLQRHLPASAFYLSIREQVFKGGCGDWEEHNTSMNMTADISRELASTTLVFQAKDQECNADRDHYLVRYDYLFKLLLIGDSDVGNSKNGIKGDRAFRR
ncbi:hypothetical protein PG990_011057 [Apiospora arundinis]